MIKIVRSRSKASSVSTAPSRPTSNVATSISSGEPRRSADTQFGYAKAGRVYETLGINKELRGKLIKGKMETAGAIVRGTAKRETTKVE